MQKEPTIKEHLKEVGEIIGRSDDPIAEYPSFIELKKAIKKLRKENKRLKETRHAEKIEQMNKAMELAGKIAESASHVAKLQLQRRSEIPFKPGGVEIPANRFGTPLEELIIQKKRPIAEFKCAKTNKPSKDGIYLVLLNTGTKIIYDFSYVVYGVFDKEVLAFTETSPEQILKALK